MTLSDKAEYYIVRKRAVPEVLRGVVKVNQLLASGKCRTVNEAVVLAGISRSSYYKFKDDIEEFHDSTAGMNVTLSCEINDEPGVLAGLLGVISGCGANILTIHQSIPISGVADLSISLQIRDNTGDISTIVKEIGDSGGVRKVRIMGRDKAGTDLQDSRTQRIGSHREFSIKDKGDE